MGSARAWTWSNIPLIRMTNINLRPGDAGSLEDLIADTRDGIFMSINKSWSIDDRRLNFQFGDQAGWLIKNGKRTQLVKNPTYTGITPQFWGSCDAICGPDEWTLWGLPNCGKGEPIQTGHVGHGAAPGALPRREGRGGPMVATGTEVDALLDRVAGALDGRADRGALPRPGLGADPLREQPDPPEPARARRARVQVRVVDRDRIGVASTNRLDEAGIRSVVERADRHRRAIGSRTRAPRSCPSPTDASTIRSSATSRPRPRPAPSIRAEGARAVIAAGEAAGLETAGSFSTSTMTVAVANSKGIRAEHRSTRATLLTVMMDGFASGAASGYAQAGSPDVGDIDAEALGVEAAAKGDADARRHRAGGRRVRGRARGVRGRRPAGVPLLHRLLGPGARGGPLLHGARQPGDGRQRLDLGRRRRSVRHARPDRLRGRRPHSASTSSRTAWRGPWCTTPPPARAPAPARPATALPAPNLFGPMALNLFMAPGDDAARRADRRRSRAACG